METIKYAIKNRWNGSVIFEAEIECEANAAEGVKLGLAVRLAYKRGANLTGANLGGADLDGANLRSANLRDANLTGANLRSAYLSDADLDGANLGGANLRDANLTGANLRDANLTGANLRSAYLSDADLRDANLGGANLRDANLGGADLRDANLRDANLRDANLTGANLRDADLRDANLGGAYLRSFKSDIWMILTQNKNEVAGVVSALREGRVDGSTYQSDCACLVGTIANVRHVPVETLERDSGRPAEQWFAMIKKGDKPGDDTGGGFAAAKALEWILEWCALNGIDAGEMTTEGIGANV